jgi:DNA repair protein RadC
MECIASAVIGNGVAMLKMQEIAYDERPREKTLIDGIQSLSNAEVVAMILGSGSRRESAVSLAARILATRGEGLSFLAEATAQELCEISGIGEAKACALLAAVELGKRITVAKVKRGRYVKSPEDICNLLMGELRYKQQELVYVVMLNIKNEIIAVENVSKGSLKTAGVSAGLIFATALKRGAYSVVLVHNHPSGRLEPSEGDIKTTEKMIEGGRLLGVKVSDHIIIAGDKYVSLRLSRTVNFEEGRK